MKRLNVTIYIGGSCKGDAGGWAAIIPGIEKTTRGRERGTTCNRVILDAATKVVEDLNELNHPLNITFKTNSQYFIKGAKNADKGALNGWKTESGAEARNADIWQKLTVIGAKGGHKFNVVEAEKNDDYIKRCSRIARGQVQLCILEGDVEA